MVALNLNINVAESDSLVSGPTPEGAYVASIVESSELSNAKGWIGVKFVFEIAEGQFKGRKVDTLVTIAHPESPKAVEIGAETLGKMTSAAGLNAAPSDTAQLHNRPIGILVKHETYTRNDGDVGTSAKAVRFSTPDAAREAAKIAPPKPAAPAPQQASPGAAAAVADQAPF